MNFEFKRTCARVKGIYGKGPVNKESGFTLIEVLIAMFIMSIALIALASLAITSMRATDGGRRMTQAITLGVHKLEELKAVPYNNLNITSGIDGGINRTCTGPVGTPPVFTCTPNPVFESYDTVKFSWTYTIKYVDIDGDNVYYSNVATYRIENSDVKLVTVNVSWHDMTGNRNISFSNVRTRL